jgi:hypothetical protein
MKPADMFCDRRDCPLRGERGQGNIIGHGQKEGRLLCTACGHAVAATQGTPFYRLRTRAERVVLVLTLLAHG